MSAVPNRSPELQRLYDRIDEVDRRLSAHLDAVGMAGESVASHTQQAQTARDEAAAARTPQRRNARKDTVIAVIVIVLILAGFALLLLGQ